MNIIFIILFIIILYLIYDSFRLTKQIDILLGELSDLVKKCSDHPELLLKNYNKITEDVENE